MCTKEEYGIKFWLPFLLYYFATTVVFILEARSLTVGLTSIVSLNGCQKTSSVYYKLPLYSSIVGNATGGIVSADAGFYFQNWHVVPSLGFCPSNNPPTNPIPALTPVAQAAADSSRRKLLAAGSSSSSAGDIDLHNKKLRKLGGAGGSSGGGGGGGSSSSSSSSSSGSSGNSNNDGNNGGSSAPVTVTGTEGKGEGNFNYKACINFGKTYTGKEDSSGPTIWKQLDKLAGLDGYNGQGAIKTSFTEGAAGLSDASSLMSLILGINCGLWSITSVLFLTYIFSASKGCYFRNSLNLVRAMLYIDFVNHVITGFFCVIVFYSIKQYNESFVGTKAFAGLAKTVFPTCTLSATEGPILPLYLIAAFMSFALAFIFIICETYWRCCRARRERFNYPEGHVICNNGHPMQRRRKDPYKEQRDVQGNKYAFCDGCGIENVFERDWVIYHCPLCREEGFDPSDFCPPCAEARIRDGNNGTLGSRPPQENRSSFDLRFKQTNGYFPSQPTHGTVVAVAVAVTSGDTWQESRQVEMQNVQPSAPYM